MVDIGRVKIMVLKRCCDDCERAGDIKSGFVLKILLVGNFISSQEKSQFIPPVHSISSHEPPEPNDSMKETNKCFSILQPRSLRHVKHVS
jgi:hypothetical protein